MSERLDRIERILEGVSAQQAETQQKFDGMQQALDRTQQIVDSNARAIEANSAAIAETRQIVASNARAIEVHSAAIAESKQTADADRAQFRASIEDMVSTILSVATQTFERIDEMQSEVRGMQTETRRIWERLERRDSE